MEKSITEFNEKFNLFVKYFSSKCNPLPNNGKLPENQTYITETKLTSFNFEDEDIYKSTVFLDISKAFEKIWLPDLILKIKSFGVSGNLLELIENFLSNRFQRVALNGQISKWEKINAGVPQGSIVGPLFFLIYINNLPDATSSIAKHFADDSSLFSVVQNKNNSASQLKNDLKKVSDWAYT